MRVAALVSGGKDSWHAVWLAMQAGWDIGRILTVRPGSDESMMWHHPNVEWVPTQAEAAGLPHAFVEVTSGNEEGLASLPEALLDADVDGFVSGAVASEFQRTRLERVGHEARLKSFAPLWHKDPLRLLRDMQASGLDARVVHVAAEGLGRHWLGRRLDEDAIQALADLQARTGVHPGGEGGEYETFVLDAPVFNRRLDVGSAEITMDRDRGTWRLDRLALAGDEDDRRPGGSVAQASQAIDHGTGLQDDATRPSTAF